MGRPNILWITTHDINPHLGSYTGIYPGAEYAVTPNLDRLAAEGMRFDKAFSVAPICAPSRSAVMTGCFPTAIGTSHMRTKAVPPPEVRLLSEYFREAGYYVTNNSFTDFQVQTPPSAFDECSDTAHWRSRPDTDAPFFATFHGMATHESQIHLDETAHAARTIDVPDEARHDPALAPLPPYYPDTETFRTVWARYNDLITQMDHWVGDILQQLAEDGLEQDTIVVFWSDHGMGLPRAKRWPNDSGLHEPLIMRWPGRISAGVVNDELVHVMDVGPTMLTLAGLDVPEHMHAVPVLTPNAAPVPEPNEYVYGGRDRQGDAHDRSRTVRDRRHRLIRHYHPDRSPMPHMGYPDHLSTWAELRGIVSQEAGQLSQGHPPDRLTPLQRTLVAPAKPEEELYDLDEDPYETRNLINDPAYHDTARRLRQALNSWLERYEDLGALDEEELLERWRPGGVSPVTVEPDVRVVGQVITASSSTPGARVVWTADPPQPADTRTPTEADAMGSPAEAIGAPIEDHRRWHILSDTAPLIIGSASWLKACRLGYLDSPEVVVT